MSRRKPALGLDPRVDTGSPIRTCANEIQPSAPTGGNMKQGMLAALAALAVTSVLAPARAETDVRIALVRSISNGAELLALDRGYFKEAGLNVTIEDINTAANTIAMLATNRL